MANDEEATTKTPRIRRTRHAHATPTATSMGNKILTHRPNAKSCSMTEKVSMTPCAELRQPKTSLVDPHRCGASQDQSRRGHTWSQIGWRPLTWNRATHLPRRMTANTVPRDDTYPPRPNLRHYDQQTQIPTSSTYHHTQGCDSPLPSSNLDRRQARCRPSMGS